MKKFQIGIQLYSVRDDLNRDFEGTLRKLAALGCDCVEFIKLFGGYSPAELKAMLDRVGLTVCGMHVDHPDDLVPDSGTSIYLTALGCRYVTMSQQWAPWGNHRAEDLAELCRRASRAAAELGCVFTYHNHCEEFGLEDGVPRWVRVVESTPPEVKFELDIGWAAYAGMDPVELIRRYGDRIKELHCKDMKPGPAETINLSIDRITELGAGCVNLAGCLEAASHFDIPCAIYEQDWSATTPLESAAQSLKHLRGLLN